MSKDWWCPTILPLSASLSSHCSGEGTQQLLGKAGSLLAQWMWFLHSFWWTLASLHLNSLTNLLLVSPGRLECLPHQEEAGRAEICHGGWSGAVVLSPGSLLPCLYYRSQQPFSFSHGHLCLSDHSSLCIFSHSPSLQYTIPTVQVKNQFPHPPVLTTQPDL